MTTGKVKGIIANLVTVAVDGPVAQNEICYIYVGETKLMAEVTSLGCLSMVARTSRCSALSKV